MITVHPVRIFMTSGVREEFCERRVIQSHQRSIDFFTVTMVGESHRPQGIESPEHTFSKARSRVGLIVFALSCFR